MGLIARGLELNGVVTTLTSWNTEKIQATLPPRATLTQLPRGATLGNPGDAGQQRRVLAATLALLAREAPLAPVLLDES